MFGVLEHIPYPGFTHLSTPLLKNTNIATPNRSMCECKYVKNGRWDRMFHSVHIPIHFFQHQAIPVSPVVRLFTSLHTHTHSLFNCDYPARSSLAHPSLEGQWAITTFLLHSLCVCVCVW